MNKLERAYSEVLQLRLLAGEIRAWRYEAMTLKLAPDTRLTVDFLVTFDTHLELMEVKGFMREDAWIKLKLAAELFPEFGFALVTREAGAWVIKPVE